ncbi:hypothetical protein BDV96DRAFT_650911 [Lophiotrema nucula]|uniref:Uncharacterized protein n=1 Tax=Lophiotrema nucula TaxID=690887 RepID=A0A6A5YTF6_9PLEO|nr:hypothetical protein BDV96DRAFT_650911 [Lophiotrema nucula]
MFQAFIAEQRRMNQAEYCKNCYDLLHKLQDERHIVTFQGKARTVCQHCKNQSSVFGESFWEFPTFPPLEKVMSMPIDLKFTDGQEERFVKRCDNREFQYCGYMAKQLCKAVDLPDGCRKSYICVRACTNREPSKGPTDTTNVGVSPTTGGLAKAWEAPQVSGEDAEIAQAEWSGTANVSQNSKDMIKEGANDEVP